MLQNFLSYFPKTFVIIFGALFVMAFNAETASAQATFRWTGMVDNSWTNSVNWAFVSGTDAGSNGYPDAGDNAEFTNAPAALTTITNADQTLGTLTLNGSALVVLDAGGNDLAPGAGFSVTGTGSIQITNGNFNPNSITVSNGTADIQTPLNVTTTTTVNGGILTLGANNSTLTGTFTLSSGTFNAGSGFIELLNNFTKSGGTFNGQTATFRFPTSASYTVTSNTAITFHAIDYNTTTGGGSINFTGTSGLQTFTIGTSFTKSNRAGGIALTSATLAYSPGATLVYSFNISSSVDPDEWPTVNGPTNVTHNGSQLTLPSSTPRTIPAGGTLVLNATGNFVANSILTINGTLERRSASTTITGTAPQFSAVATDNSQLIYSLAGGTTTIGLEWPATNSPRNVRLEGTSSPIVQTANGSGTVTRTVANNLQILTGTLRGEDGTSDILNVDVGGTLETGTLTSEGTFANGTITMTGTGNQSIVGGAGSATISNLTINKGTTTDVVTVTGGILRVAPTGVLRIQNGVLALSGIGTNVLNVIGATFRIDNGGTFRTGGKTIDVDGTTAYQLNDGSVFEYNGTTTENALSIDANGASAMTPSNSYSILRVSNSINIPTTDLDVRTELRFNTSVNATVNSGGTNGIIRLGLGATITGDNSTTTRFVNGPLRRFFNGTNLTGTFAVGKVLSTAGANDVTIQFQSLGSEIALTIEQFNANPSGTITGGGITTNARYWQFLDPSRALSSENYRLTVDIAGSNISTPLNQIVRLTGGTFGSGPTFAAPEGTPQVDDGVTVSNAVASFPYTSLAAGATPGFTLAQIGGKVWDGGASTTSWFDANNWDPDGVPIAADNVIIGSPTVPNPTVVVGTGTAVSNTINVGGLSGSPVLRIDNVDAIDFDNVTVGAQWLAARTTFGATSTVEYLQGNVRSDQYANLTVDGTGALGTAGGAIVVVGNFIKSNSSIFSPTHDIGVTGNFTINGGTFNAGSQSYTVGGNFTRTATFNANTSTFEFNAGVARQLTGTTTFHNLTKSNSGTVDLQASTNVTVNNVFNLDDGVFSINANNTLTLNGTITGGGFLSGTTTSNLSLGGSGGSIGTIQFQAGNRLLNNFTLNRTGLNPSATLGSDITASGTLTMTSGILNTTTTNLLTTALTSGGSASSYVNGPLAIGGTGSSSPKVYPIGKGTTFRPVELATSSPTTVQRMELFNLDPRGVPAAPLLALSIFRYWEGTNIQANDQIRLSYDAPNDGIITPNTNLRVASSTTGVGGSNVFSNRGSNAVGTPLLGATSVLSDAALPASAQQFFTFGSVNLADAPLPVELVSFVGTGSRKGIELSWRTGSERESFGFVVNRRRAGGNWEVLDSYERNPSLRARNSLSGAEYFFIDRSPMNAGDVLEYRLDEVAFDGTVERLKEIRVEAAFSTIVTDYALEQNYPNPFNPATTIPYQLKDRAKVTLDIYNALGQKIATLVNAEQESGRYAPTFNAAALASGMYFYRLQAVGARESFTQTRKMMLVK